MTSSELRDRPAILDLPARVVPFPKGSSAGGHPMKRLNVVTFFELGVELGRLRQLIDAAEVKVNDAFFTLTSVSRVLDNYIDEEGAFSLSKEEATKLRWVVNKVFEDEFFDIHGEKKVFKSGLDFNSTLTPFALVSIRPPLDEFVHVFSAEGRGCETYFIEARKLGYDISTLMRGADERVHETVRSIVPEQARREMRAAGRCLALESYTASGFHALRAMEVVIAEYYKAVSQKDKEFKSWNDYIQALDELEREREATSAKFPSRKVVSMLDRIRQLDRNPLMHPRESLDEMGADTLFSLAVTTITEMAKDLREMAGQSEMKLVASDGQLAAPPARKGAKRA